MKRFMLAIMTGATILMMTASFTATAAPDSWETVKKVTEGKMQGHIVIPTTAGGIMAVKFGNKMYIMSENGRFIFDGVIYDTWHHGKALNSMADIRKYALQVDLGNLNVDFSKIATAYIGQGGPTTTIFVTTACVQCERMMEYAQSLKKNYRFRFIVVPRGSVGALIPIVCASSQKEARQAFIGLYNGLQKKHVFNPEQACRNAAAYLTTTALVAKMVGVSKVPFVIAPDGRVKAGLKPANLEAFIEGQGQFRR